MQRTTLHLTAATTWHSVGVLTSELPDRGLILSDRTWAPAVRCVANSSLTPTRWGQTRILTPTSIGTGRT
ncbi:MAG: hypothetical protein MNPFHGCM_00867 [Gemmatimonadaceae bacterium]|nr:hypothetical protein [Gemmatimonadaceae bacterium]